MKIKGQHGEFGWTGPPENPQPVGKRQIEIDDDERIKIIVRNKLTGVEEEVLTCFVAGVLTLEWEKGATLDSAGEGGL